MKTFIHTCPLFYKLDSGNGDEDEIIPENDGIHNTLLSIVLFV